MAKKQISVFTNPLAKQEAQKTPAAPLLHKAEKPQGQGSHKLDVPAATVLKDEDVEKFILAGERPPEGYKLTKKAKASKLRRANRGERFSIYLPEELAEAVRIYCAKEKCSKSHAVTTALEQMLNIQIDE